VGRLPRAGRRPPVGRQPAGCLAPPGRCASGSRAPGPLAARHRLPTTACRTAY